MKRKVTDLEQKLINDGWCLTIKRYTGKHSEKTHCYEYHKTSDITNNGKSYDLFIRLDQKRSQITKYGIKNLVVEMLDDEELTHIRFVFLELRHYVERIENEDDFNLMDTLMYTAEKLNEIANGFKDSELDEKQELPPMTPEQFDEMCQEMENENAKGS